MVGFEAAGTAGAVDLYNLRLHLAGDLDQRSRAVAGSRDGRPGQGGMRTASSDFGMRISECGLANGIRNPKAAIRNILAALSIPRLYFFALVWPAEIVRRDVQVGEYVVAVADGPVVRQRAAIDRADVVENDFARVVFVGGVQFDADEVGVFGVEIEACFDAGGAWRPGNRRACRRTSRASSPR